MATVEEVKRSRRRANRTGQAVALLVALGGLAIVVAPTIASKKARDVISHPFSDRSVAKTIETVAADGTRTVETTWAEESVFDKALAGGGAVLVRLGMVVAAAFLAGAAAQRAYLAHFALELGPIKLAELPETADASRDAVLVLTTRLDEQDKLIASGSLATERALLSLISQQVSDKEEFARASQSLQRLRAEHDQQRRDLDKLSEAVAIVARSGPRKWLGGPSGAKNRTQP
jgi:hypothetical protein